jgi:hypothetical protein
MEAEDLLHRNMVSLVGDSTTLEILAVIPSRIIGFTSCDERREESEWLFGINI